MNPTGVLHSPEPKGTTERERPIMAHRATATSSDDYPFDDLIVIPSRTRADTYHVVHVNVLAGCTDGCNCEAGKQGQVCWARKQVDANEGSWGFRRCVECGALCLLGRWHTGSGASVAIWLCPREDEHHGHEAAADVLMRTPQENSFAIGSRGSWRLRGLV